ncbi:transport and Golgi organization protein 1 homolog isoform X2 [Pristis pectinata]|uniref:transport and Golgi organization protein 1 homolog isoform X2 n=1 Tax=Pristis pectinata TaxID=685728 RepID=UPI00223D2FCA|nr:transport and Golgi organization protein 1 homolog isoform X2 [Pristis pectinata]
MAAVLREMCLWALLVAAAGSGQKLFSDLKRCLDEECSMLMCRGKAVKDFVGPDCRFLKFKAGETIYVYYKLAGKRNDLWAGSVGSQFGYFPKDLIEINLVYSTTEVELPAEDTDFVCFDEGPEEFDEVDIDNLVRIAGSSEGQSKERAAERDASPREDDTGQRVPDDESGKSLKMPGAKSGDNKASEGEEAVQSAEQEVGDSLPQTEDRGAETVVSPLSDERTLHVEDEEPAEKPADVGDNISSLEDHSMEEDGSSHVKVSRHLESNSQEPETLTPTDAGSEGRNSLDAGELLAAAELESQEGEQKELLELEGSSALETGFGSTRDAIVVDHEVTSKVTASDEEPEFDVELDKDDLAEPPERIPLLSYSDDKSVPQQGGVQDVDVGEGSKSSKADTKTTTQAVDTPVASISPEKRQPLDGVIEKTAENEEALTSEDKKSGGLWTTLGETFSAIVSGDETTSKVTDPYGSEDLPEDTRDGNSEDPEEEDRIYLLSMSEEEAGGEFWSSAGEEAETRVAVRDMVTEDPEATVQALDTSSETATNVETLVNEDEGTEQQQHIASVVESRSSGQYAEDKLQTKEVVGDESVTVPERDENSPDIELQGDAEVKSVTEMNQDPAKFDQSELETGMDEPSGSSEHASTEGLGTVNEGLKSEDQMKVVTSEGFPTEDVNTTLSQGAVEAEDQTSSGTSDTDPEVHKVVKSKDDVGKSDERDVSVSSGSYSELDSNGISDEDQGEEDSEDDEALYELLDDDQPEELLEDENAADARMARERDASAAREAGLDHRELDVHDMNVTEEGNIVEPEDLQDDGEDVTNVAVEEDHEVEKEGGHPQNIQGQANWIENQKKSEQSSPRPVDRSEDWTQDRKNLSGVLHKERGEFGKDLQTEESAEGEGRWPGAYSRSENTSDLPKVEGNKTEDTMQPTNDIGAEDASKVLVGLKYQEAVEKLTILKGSLGEKSFELVQKYLSPRQVLEVEAVLHDLEVELKLAKLSGANEQNIENILDNILEESESRILDMVENMLDKRAEMSQWNTEDIPLENDEEMVVLNDLQELMFHLRMKYSAIKDSVALAPGEQLSEERNRLLHESLDKGKQEGLDREEEEELARGLPSPRFTEDASRSEGKQETGRGKGPRGELDSAESEREKVRETQGEMLPPEEDLQKELPSANTPEDGVGQGQEVTVTGPTSPYFTQRRPSGQFEETEAPPQNITGRMEEAGRKSSPEEGVGLAEAGRRRSGERVGGTGSSVVRGRAEEEVRGEQPIPNTEGRKESRMGPPVVRVGKSDGDSADDGPLKEERREADGAGEVTVEGVADGARLEAGRGSLPSQERSRWLPWIISALDGVILATSNTMRPIIHSLSEFLISSLPEEMRPGPDFHGVPWEPILITAALGILTFFIFMWRTCLSVKSRRYQITEKQLAEKIKQLIQEKTEALEKVSNYEKKLEEAKTLISEAQNVKSTASVETKELEESCRELEQVNLHLETRVKNLQASLDKEKQETANQQTMIADTQKSVKKLQKVISAHSAELTQVQEALCGAKTNEEKLQADLQSVLEENARLKQSKSQLLKEAEGWSERHSELNEQIKLCQKAQRDLEEALAYKDNEIEVLTDCVMQLRQLDTESDSEDNGWDKEVDGEVANGELPDKSKKTKMKIQQMMDVSRVKTTLKIIEEEKDHFQAKLTDEIRARHELEEQIKQLEHNFAATETEKSRLENEFKTMQQKLEILTELYHQKEMALQKRLTQEECQRQEKELKLSVADEKALQALEEVKMYKQRIQEMEEELQKTERSFKNQIAAHEKKAHENWLSARSAERTLTEEKRETANLRQKMIELNQKLSQVQRPSIIKPTPGRPDRQVPPGAPPPLGPGRRAPVSRDDSYGPSPVSAGPPSPPMMMDLLVRPPSVNAGRGFPRDRGDGGHRVPPGALPPREWIGPGPDRLGPSSDHGSPPPQWDRRPGPMDGYPGPRRPPSESGIMSGRISGPGEIRGLPLANRVEMGSGGPGQLPSGPRTSSPNMMECAMQDAVAKAEEPASLPNPPSEQSKAVTADVSQAAPSFPGTPIMNSPLGGMPPPGPRHGPPAPRGTYGPVPVPLPQNHLVRVPALRDYPPGPFPPPGHRPFLPGPLPPPHALRDFPPGAREFPRGPRSLPPGPTPPPGARDFPPGPDNRQ